MEFGQLQAFVATARSGSFTRAAEQLDLTQPSLSARVQQLEGQVGGRLLRRRSRPVQLTPLGEVLLPYAERALEILATAEDALRAARQGAVGRISVSCPFSSATYLMPDVINRFNKSYPAAELSIIAGNSDYAVATLLDGVVDMALAAAFPKFLTAAQTIARLHDEMVVAVAPDHPLAAAGARRQPLELAAIWPYQLVLVPWGASFEAYLESWQYRERPERPPLRVPLAAALPMLRRPDTVAFMPHRLAVAAGLMALTIPAFSFAWDVVLLTRTGRLLSPLEQAFVDIVQSVWQTSGP